MVSEINHVLKHYFKSFTTNHSNPDFVNMNFSTKYSTYLNATHSKSKANEQQSNPNELMNHSSF